MKESKKLKIRKGCSQSPDPARAAQELYEALLQPEISPALFFCDPDYDLDVLGRELRKRFNGINLIGCTTAGEITPKGYLHGSLTGVSIADDNFHTATGRLDNLHEFELAQAETLVQTLIHDLQLQGANPTGENTFGFLLIDGLCMREEAVVSALYRSLNGIRLFGG